MSNAPQISRFAFKRRGFFHNDISGVLTPDEFCSFGFMGCINGNVTYFFGGYDNTATCNYSADWDGEAHSFDLTATNTITKEQVVNVLNTCKSYIVNYAHKLTSEQYDEMVAGVGLWCDEKNFTGYYNTFSQSTSQCLPSFGDQGLEISILSGTESLVRVGASYGFNAIAKVVDNIFLTAYEESISYQGDTPVVFFSYDTIRRAVEDEYITDPDIIDFINDNTWDEFTETAIDWVINIDGVKNPNINIAWSGSAIDHGDIDGGTATITLQIAAYTSTGVPAFWYTMGTYSYDNRFYDTTYNKLAQEAGDPSFMRNLLNIFWDSTVKIRMYATYFREGGMNVTSTAEATLSYKGQGSGSILPPRDGSTITFTHTSTDEFKDDFLDSIEVPDNPDGTSASSKQQTYSGIGVMTRTYVMSKSRLQQLGRFLWSYNFYDFIQNLNSSPIENIVSIKMLPFEIPGGEDEEIVLGNVATGVLGKPVDIDYNCKHVINSGGTTIAKKYSAKYNYLNSAPYTKLSIFLPYIGFKSLDPAVFLDKKLLVEYICDIITGSCVAMIYADNVPITQFTGEIGLDVPISAGNRAQVEAGILQSVGQVATSAMSQNAGGMIGGALSILNQSYHTDTQGIASPCCNSFITHDVFYILDTPCVQFPSRYAHTHGLPLFLSKTLRNVKGFTVCENVDTSGIPGATQEEKEMIKQALESGVYL